MASPSLTPTQYSRRWYERRAAVRWANRNGHDMGEFAQVGALTPFIAICRHCGQEVRVVYRENARAISGEAMFEDCT